MSPKLPVLSGDQLIRALSKFGYIVVRQKGSHVRLRHSSESQRQAVTVPLHAEVASGTLRRILRDTRVTVEQLIAAL
jgi:predicted RNA binding protein YcfA (HicA-like mRNA interferase family)